MSEAAAVAAQTFTKKDGVKDTTVHETVAPAVTEETVVPKRHEQATVALDREVHQEHYHTSVLPIQDNVVLPEKHEHVMRDVEHKEHRHGDHGTLKRLLAEEAAKFKDLKTEAETIVTHKEAPSVTGEHVHHHVHEIIQPVIQKEVVAPTVVHTTIPVREVHHQEAKHHSATHLPPITLAEFKKQGGSLTGREARTETFTGEPRAAGETTSSAANTAASGLTGNANTSIAPSGTPNPAAGAAPDAAPNATSNAAPNAAANTTPANDQAAGRSLVRSPTGPAHPRKNTMRGSSGGHKEV